MRCATTFASFDVLSLTDLDNMFECIPYLGSLSHVDILKGVWNVLRHTCTGLSWSGLTSPANALGLTLKEVKVQLDHGRSIYVGTGASRALQDGTSLVLQAAPGPCRACLGLPGPYLPTCPSTYLPQRSQNHGPSSALPPSEPPQVVP